MLCCWTANKLRRPVFCIKHRCYNTSNKDNGKRDRYDQRVITSLGVIRGDVSTYDPAIRVFRGIPYACTTGSQAPVAITTTADSWQGELDATVFGTSCYQERHTSAFVWRREDFSVSEDCLYLNIWSEQDAESRPVMVCFMAVLILAVRAIPVF